MSLDPSAVHRAHNQLTIILGFVEMLIDQCQDEAMRADLDEVRRAAQVLVTLIPALDAPDGSTR
jgi:hypothetical protein